MRARIADRRRQHITRRFTEDEIGPLLGELRDRIATLEAELRSKRAAASQATPKEPTP